MQDIKRRKGFTLIELMIVIAIVAILVALAVPAYRDYTIRAKVGECVNQAAVAKLQISEYRQTVGIFPPDEDEAGTAAVEQTQYCDGYTYLGAADGTFEIITREAEIDGSIAGLTIQPQMTPWVSATGEVNWICQRGDSTSTEALKYLPSTCRGATS